MAGDSTTLVTICREPLAVTLRFLAWHREQGFDRILLYLDDPCDPVLAWIADKPWIEPVLCRSEFWQSVGIEPTAVFTLRQVRALTHGYRSVLSGWVAVADADELFHFGGRQVGEALATLPEGTQAVRVGVAEFVGRFRKSMRFRMPMTKAEASHVYGRDAYLFRQAAGLIGHSAGKSITRAGLPVRRMRPHWAVPSSGQTLVTVRAEASDQMALLHLNAPDFTAWRAKLEWRLGAMGGTTARVRRAVEEAYRSADRDVALRVLYDRLFTLRGPALHRLNSCLRLLRIADDLDTVTRRHFPDVPPVPTPVADAGLPV